ncbi:MAG: hypothetical protein FWC43_12560 [Planctomycetaceae bacterium]|nr:hypothetical protein [Planctomycetaceae bacterium]
MTDQTIYDHLAGKQTIGVYPLLVDETCYFLAVDFDDDHWRDDIREFVIDLQVQLKRGQKSLDLKRRQCYNSVAPWTVLACGRLEPA